MSDKEPPAAARTDWISKHAEGLTRQERGGSFTGFAFRNANSFSVFHLEPVECYGPFQAMKNWDKDITLFLEGCGHYFHLSCFFSGLVFEKGPRWPPLWLLREKQRSWLIIYSLRTLLLASTFAICEQIAAQGYCTLNRCTCGCGPRWRSETAGSSAATEHMNLPAFQLRCILKIAVDKIHITVECLHDLQSIGFQGLVWFTG